MIGRRAARLMAELSLREKRRRSLTFLGSIDRLFATMKWYKGPENFHAYLAFTPAATESSEPGTDP